VATNKEYSLVLIRMSDEFRQLVCILPQCLLRIQEFGCGGIAFKGFDGGGVEGGGAPFGRGHHDLDVICEDFIWVSKFGLVVRGTLARVEEDGVEGGDAGY